MAASFPPVVVLSCVVCVVSVGERVMSNQLSPSGLPGPSGAGVVEEALVAILIFSVPPTWR